MILLDKVNEVFFRVNCSTGEALELKEHFSCYANNYKFSPKFRARIWNGKIGFFDLIKRTLPIGLLPEFHDFCKKFSYSYKYNFNESELKNNIDPTVVKDFCLKLLEDNEITPRDYQIKSVYESIKNKRGVVAFSTGGGKSNSIYLTIRLLLTQDPDKKILLIVPTTTLVEQMYSDFKDYGWDNIQEYVTKLYADTDTDYNKNVLISTWQSAIKKPDSFFQKYSVLLIDECHSMTSLSIQTIAKKCVNASYRIGYTGTIPKPKIDKFNLFGYLGTILCSTNSKDLIKKGILSKIKIINVKTKYPQPVIDKNKYRPYSEEVSTIEEYPKRNKVFKYIFKYILDKQNTLILCSRIKHLKNIQEYLKKNLDSKYTIVNIYGKVKPAEREKIRKLIEEKENMILIGTYSSLSTGVNIKKLHNLIFASSAKSYIRVLQTIGRGLRTHKDKDVMILFDIIDDLCWKKRTGNIGENYAFQHWKERKTYYREQGFKDYEVEYQL